MKEVGFAGDFAAFVRYLNTDPKFFHKDADALLAGYRAIAKQIDPELPKLFAELPRTPYGVRPMPADFGADTAAFYSEPALDGSRAGLLQRQRQGVGQAADLGHGDAGRARGRPGPSPADRARRWSWASCRSFAAPTATTPTAKAGRCMPRRSASTSASTAIRTAASATCRRRRFAPRGWSSTPGCTPSAGAGSGRSTTWSSAPARTSPTSSPRSIATCRGRARRSAT